MPAKNPITCCPGCIDPARRQEIPTEKMCTPCRKKERNRIWREANPGAMAANAKRWRDAGNKSARSEESLARARERSRERYRTDEEYRQRQRDYAREYRGANPEKVADGHRRWRAANLTKSQEYQREYQRNWRSTADGKAAARETRAKRREQRQIESARRYARMQGREGDLPNSYLFWLHKWQDHCCAYCNTPMEQKNTLDHVVPLHRGGTNFPYNVLLVCPYCNQSKSDRLLTEWEGARYRQPTRKFSHWGTKEAAVLLARAGIRADKRGDALVLPNGRSVLVMSSFWLSERLGRAPAATVAEIAAAHPDAVLTWDFEWKERPEAMVNSVGAKGAAGDSTGARSLVVETPTPADAKDFLSRWHIQGFSGGSVYAGLREPGGEWRGVCSISRTSDGKFSLARVAFRGRVQGGLGRLMASAARQIGERAEVVTYADPRFGAGKSYESVGFARQGSAPGSYHLVNGVGLHHWNNYTKNRIAERCDFFDESWEAWRLEIANGLWRIQDLPLRRFSATLNP